MEIESWIAIYAAIVATGALTLEVRRWFESGPRVRVRVQPNMAIAGETRWSGERYVVATVRNRGTVATTITTLGFVKYPSQFHRRLRWRGEHFVVPAPYLEGRPPSLPHLLEPGQQWLGFIKKSDEDREAFENGNNVVEVYTSDRDRPYRVVVPRNKSPEHLGNQENEVE
ncbi:hypothetical protein [Ruegeria profundi]|uniref:hypothetical protein n=1 Tax=Ruegeria profundi TaxID=1685378 RepID=UPI003C7ABC5B